MRRRRVLVDCRGGPRLAPGETRINALSLGAKYTGCRCQIVESGTEILSHQLRPLPQRQAERGFKFSSPPNRPTCVARKSRTFHFKVPPRKPTQIPSEHSQLRILRALDSQWQSVS